MWTAALGRTAARRHLVSSPQLLRNQGNCNPAFGVRHGYGLRSFHATTTNTNTNTNSGGGLILDMMDPLTGYPIFNRMASALVWVHDHTGISWAATIILLAFGLRMGVMLPLNVYAIRNVGPLKSAGMFTAQLASSSPNTTNSTTSTSTVTIHRNSTTSTNTTTKNSSIRIVDYAKDTVLSVDPVGLARAEASAERTLVREAFGLSNPARLGISAAVVVLPLWLLVTVTLRFLTMMPESALGADALFALESLRDEGILYVTDLTQPDPTLITPTVYLSALLGNIALQRSGDTRPRTLASRAMYSLRLALSVLGALVSAVVPAAVSLFWVFSALFMGANLLLARTASLAQGRLTMRARLGRAQLHFINTARSAVASSFNPK